MDRFLAGPIFCMCACRMVADATLRWHYGLSPLKDRASGDNAHTPTERAVQVWSKDIKANQQTAAGCRDRKSTSYQMVDTIRDATF